jgi:hypothetical protein
LPGKIGAEVSHRIQGNPEIRAFPFWHHSCVNTGIRLLEPCFVSLSSSISAGSPLFGLSHARPLKDLFGDQNEEAKNAAASPSADLLRMIQGVMKPEKPEKSSASDHSQDIYAEIKVGGKTVATIYNDGSAATSNALARKAKLSDGEGLDLAEKRSQELAAAAGGAIVKPNKSVSQAQWMAQQADKAGAVVDPVQQEKQRSYSGLQERRMIADPSMLLQAQLFAQQTMGFDAQSAMSYVPPLDDQMKTDTAFA